MSTSPAPISAPLGLRGGRLSRIAASPVLPFLGRRLLAAIPVLWGVTFLTFLTLNALPGDTAQQLLGVVTGDLGHSLVNGESVTSTLISDLPVTFELIGVALVVALLIAVAMALVAARRPNGIFDRVSMVLTMAGLSIAPYVLALLLVYVFAVKLNVLPDVGWTAPGDSLWGNIRSLILPATALGLSLMCFYTRLLRADLIQQLSG